jgi:hypothetical protein
MKWITYFLILFLGWAQADDAWTFAGVVESVQFPADNDEYLPSPMQTWKEESAPQKEPVLVPSNLRTVDFSLFRSAVPAEWRLAAPLTDSLYVFMSLQI